MNRIDVSHSDFMQPLNILIFHVGYLEFSDERSGTTVTGQGTLSWIQWCVLSRSCACQSKSSVRLQHRICSKLHLLFNQTSNFLVPKEQCVWLSFRFYYLRKNHCVLLPLALNFELLVQQCVCYFVLNFCLLCFTVPFMLLSIFNINNCFDVKIRASSISVQNQRVWTPSVMLPKHRVEEGPITASNKRSGLPYIFLGCIRALESAERWCPGRYRAKSCRVECSWK